ncbi:TBC1 domain family member 22B-like isoform X1 [Varroa jacobsoni]|uniref:Rab-GAP TBC domain-containing protein n=1 Tax=Varroa destructor TaxID=109461 RepID=A0A7M7K6T7_VARDE|nr:TBC1 domain family member 22B-like isoform X1 [Varroa destructor]XP_022699361.1 TBC1 domain family member 22B-like isoform X1 [Varroa jacobsoni]XP_022699363.1 TBC1 domain family member 22B-like isoform X1 [Varroa jacobsoni]
METTNDNRNGNTWKKYSTRSVPGRTIPLNERAFPSKPALASANNSFQNFQAATEDVWDVGDDEFCHISESKVLSISPPNTKPPSLIVKNLEEQVGNLGFNGERQDLVDGRGILEHERDSLPLPAITGTRRPGIAVRRGAEGWKPSVRAFEPPQRKGLEHKFQDILDADEPDLEKLRALSWKGIPTRVRPLVWKILSGHLPANTERRRAVLDRKREEYFGFVEKYYDNRCEDQMHQETYRQIHIDIPRMSPLVPLFQQPTVQLIFERILYIWSIRHPASGYVQGMNDLVTPFFVVFLCELAPPHEDVEVYDVACLAPTDLRQIEADSYWCMSMLLDGIQDNYTFAQPGIQAKVGTLRMLMQRVDRPLFDHLEGHAIEFLQFTFRWMNNLLMRELPLRCTVRLWDTYLAEGDSGFSVFHLYVCAAFLKHFSKELLRERDFQGLMLLLQNLPTSKWGDAEITLLVAEAYNLKYMFADAPNHLLT